METFCNAKKMNAAAAATGCKIDEKTTWRQFVVAHLLPARDSLRAFAAYSSHRLFAEALLDDRGVHSHTKTLRIMSQDDDPEIEQDDELSAMAWELAARGKSGREIAQLHETWAAALLARNDFDRAQVRGL